MRMDALTIKFTSAIKEDRTGIVNPNIRIAMCIRMTMAIAALILLSEWLISKIGMESNHYSTAKGRGYSLITGFELRVFTSTFAFRGEPRTR